MWASLGIIEGAKALGRRRKSYYGSSVRIPSHSGCDARRIRIFDIWDTMWALIYHQFTYYLTLWTPAAKNLLVFSSSLRMCLFTSYPQGWRAIWAIAVSLFLLIRGHCFTRNQLVILRLFRICHGYLERAEPASREPYSSDESTLPRWLSFLCRTLILYW